MTWAMLGAMTQAKMARDWLGKVMGTFGPRRCAGGELGGRSKTRVALFPSARRIPSARKEKKVKVRMHLPSYQTQPSSGKPHQPRVRAHPCSRWLC